MVGQRRDDPTGLSVAGAAIGGGVIAREFAAIEYCLEDRT